MWRISIVGVRMLENWTLRRIFGPKCKKEARKLIMDKNA
jgi:hypothetical protein